MRPHLPANAAYRVCPRCQAALHPRKPDAARRTAALLIAGYLLYVPTGLPVTTLQGVGGDEHHTIMSGVFELIHNDLWPLALIVFMASIVLPLVKLTSLTWMLIAVRRRSATLLRTRTRLYRTIDAVGRWSNIDSRAWSPPARPHRTRPLRRASRHSPREARSRGRLSLTTGRLREEVETAGYFVCSEALASRQACGGGHVSISVAVADDRVQIRIVDDGVGGADPAGGSGIRGIRDRVESLGGILVVESAPGAGTSVLADLPLGNRPMAGPIRRHGAPDHTHWSPGSIGCTAVRRSEPSWARAKANAKGIPEHGPVEDDAGADDRVRPGVRGGRAQDAGAPVPQHHRRDHRILGCPDRPRAGRRRAPPRRSAPSDRCRSGCRGTRRAWGLVGARRRARHAAGT